MAFGGTFTLSLSTYHALLRDLCRSILGAGFRRIVLVNSHGGNIAALSALAVELTRELDAAIATVTYFVEAADAVAGILEDQANVMHACEGETAMMMALAPTSWTRRAFLRRTGRPSTWRPRCCRRSGVCAPGRMSRLAGSPGTHVGPTRTRARPCSMPAPGRSPTACGPANPGRDGVTADGRRAP